MVTGISNSDGDELFSTENFSADGTLWQKKGFLKVSMQIRLPLTNVGKVLSFFSIQSHYYNTELAIFYTIFKIDTPVQEIL
jgi:hypothetical protein